MKIVIPMTGMGRRFLNAGYTDPKPLIQAQGKSIIEHIIQNFSAQDSFVFICNEIHLKTTSLAEVLANAAPRQQILTIAAHQKGPVYAVDQIADHLENHEPVIVNYCDFNWKWDYEHFCQRMKDTRVDGAVIGYRGFHPHLLGPNLYAGCRTDAHERLLEIREKFSFTENKMDSFHSSGTYYFSRGALLKDYFKRTLQDSSLEINGEYYVSVVYKKMLQDHLNLSVYEIPYFCQWGTPQDLKEFDYWEEYFRNPVIGARP